MSKIKSALELALERTADVEVDKDAIRRDESAKKGKTLAGRYISDPKSVSLKSELQALSGEELGWAREGVLETLLANLTLPRYEIDISRLPMIADGLKAIGPEKGQDAKTLDYLMGQYSDLFKQYLENLRQLEEHLRTQWEPRLRQKEQQLRQQTGQAVRLTPEQDPEFAKVLSEELSRMDEQYAEVLAQGKAEIRKLIG